MIARAFALLALLLAAACATGVEEPEASAFASERIAVTVRGEGPDVVLIPDLGMSPATWETTIEAVTGYRYHLVHIAGFAGRPAGANASGPVVEPVAEEIARYIRESELQSPAIVGHSLGGTWGMIVAARHPELVSRLMVVDMFPFAATLVAGDSATPDSVRPLAESFRHATATGAGDARRADIERAVAEMVRTESLRPLAVRERLASDRAVTGQAMYDLFTTDLRPELANIRAPLTVLWVQPRPPALSDEQMAAFYRRSYANAPRARIVHVPESYHFIQWDAPDVFRRELRTFLSGR